MCHRFFETDVMTFLSKSDSFEDQLKVPLRLLSNVVLTTSRQEKRKSNPNFCGAYFVYLK